MMNAGVLGLLILPDGVVTRIFTDTAAEARLLIGDELDVVAVRHPYFEPRSHVLFVDDHGISRGLGINFKAWALYGGSPIHGAALLGRDDHGPISEEVIELLTDDRFPPAQLRAQMDAWLEANP
jgi:hypothetical protein